MIIGFLHNKGALRGNTPKYFQELIDVFLANIKGVVPMFAKTQELLMHSKKGLKGTTPLYRYAIKLSIQNSCILAKTL